MADNKLAIKRLTLYKHGVGFVEREGQVSNSEVELVFRQAEVNDVLKSLLVIDRQGGQVRGIHYETPRSNYPMENRIVLSEDNSLLDLLRSLRGQIVRVGVGEGTASRDYTGQLLGVEVDPNRPLNRSLVAILDQTSPSANTVLTFALEQLKSIVILEERIGQDLRYFLDSSRNDEAHRTITLQLDTTQTNHDLLVSYLVPCPTWRVSYRLLAETKPEQSPTKPDETEQQTTDSINEVVATNEEDRLGELLLQGWGLFDNRLEEDLENVNVRLVAGQPISFIYDLATSRIPERPVVQDQARIAAGPVEFAPALEPMMQSEAQYDKSYNSRERSQASPKKAMLSSMSKEESFATGSMGGGGGPGASYKPQMAQQAPAATGSAIGELFQYNVTAPVSVKRGESALVPILSSTLPYRHQLLYNGQKIAQHPVSALRFKNTTGLVLERGPITVVEDDEYRGEALIPFSPADMEVYLAYAVELGIKVTESYSSSVETYSIQIHDQYLYLNQFVTTITTYQLENKLTESRIVTIEKPINTSYELVNTSPTSEKTAEVYRWKVPCQAQRLTKFLVQERMQTTSTESIFGQSYERLGEFLRQNWLDASTIQKLKTLLDEQSAINQNNQEINEVSNERQELYNRQEQLRRNMSALSTSGDESKLRRQVFDQLSQSESRLAAIDKRISELKEANKRHQKNIEDFVRTLNAKEKQK